MDGRPKFLIKIFVYIKYANTPVGNIANIYFYFLWSGNNPTSDTTEIYLTKYLNKDS